MSDLFVTMFYAGRIVGNSNLKYFSLKYLYTKQIISVINNDGHFYLMQCDRIRRHGSCKH